MPLLPMTTEFMKRLPAGLRPNPWNIEDEIIKLADDGWTISDMVLAVMGDNPRQPGHVVAQLRRMQDQPPPIGHTTGWKYGHQPCPQHDGESCEICHCVPGTPTHHQSAPIPADFPRLTIGRTV